MEKYKPISAGEVSAVTGNIFRYFGRMFLYTFNAVKRHYFLFILTSAAVMAAGIYFNKSRPSHYSSQMACTFNHLHKKVFGEMVLRLNNMAYSGAFKQLAEELKIEEADARSIIRLEARNLSGSMLHEDITENRHPIYITAVTSNREVYPVIQEALISHLNSTIPYYNNRRNIEKLRTSEKKQLLESSILQIDRALEKHIAGGWLAAGDSSSSLAGIARLIELKHQLEDQKLEVMKSGALQEPIELLYGFSPTPFPNAGGGIGLLKLIVLSVLTGILFTLIYTMFMK